MLSFIYFFLGWGLNPFEVWVLTPLESISSKKQVTRDINGISNKKKSKNT